MCLHAFTCFTYFYILSSSQDLVVGLVLISLNLPGIVLSLELLVDCADLHLTLAQGELSLHPELALEDVHLEPGVPLRSLKPAS